MEGGVTIPIIGIRVHNDALHRCSGIVTFQAGSLAAVVARDNYGAPIWIKQNL